MSKRSKDSLCGELCQALSKLQKDGTFTDVTLECDDGVTIPAHRVVLAAQSSVFKAMFSDGFQEGATSIAKIRGFRSAIVKLMVAFMYGFVDESHYNLKLNPTIPDLFLAAHQYDFSRIVSGCERYMIDKLDSNNAAEFFLKAYLTDTVRLKTAAMKFISENFNEVEQTDEWKELAKNYPQAIHDLLAFVCKKE